MPDLHLERDFAVSPETLFAYLSTPQGLVQWWGPEGVYLGDHKLDLSKLGPWFSCLIGRESGHTFKASGQVTSIVPNRSIGMTWAWHDEADQRGPESHVTFTIHSTGTGCRLTLDHRDLPDTETVEAHEAGWTSTLRKLTQLMTDISKGD